MRTFRKALRMLSLWILTALLAALLAVLVAVLLIPPPSRPSGAVVKSVLIIDSLYEWVPNDHLLANLTRMLSSAKYSVKVIKGSEATVDAFRNLTAYDIVIIRCHGAYLKAGETLGGKILRDVAPLIFTGEEYSDCLPFYCKYFLERLREEVMGGTFPFEGGEVKVFALTPLFFEGLEGKFREGSVVIIASCYGLAGGLLASAFLGKGATYFISWDWRVTPQHMDDSLMLLIEEAVVKGAGWIKAVEAVNKKLGPDPLEKGELKLALARE